MIKLICILFFSLFLARPIGYRSNDEFFILSYNSIKQRSILKPISYYNENSALVKIMIKNNQEDIIGSGISIKYNHITGILTNRHVCSSLREGFPTSIEYSQKAHVNYVKKYYIDIRHDVCFIPMNIPNDLAIMELSSKIAKKTDMGCYWTYNNVQGVDGQFKNCGLFVSDDKLQISPINGDSGSPVFNEENQFMGLIYASWISNNVVYGYYVNKKQILKFMEDLNFTSSKQKVANIH